MGQESRAVGQGDRHEAGASRLSYISAASYAQQALSDYCAALSDSSDVDIRMEAAAAKMFNTEVCWRVMDEAMQMRAGRGYETERSLAERGESSFPLERALRDTRINRIVEGTTDVMHLFLAREALDPHLRVTGTLFKKNATLGDKIKTLLRCAVSYSGWYPKLYLGGIFKWYLSYDRKLAAHLRWVERRSRKLARTLFIRCCSRDPSCRCVRTSSLESWRLGRP